MRLIASLIPLALVLASCGGPEPEAEPQAQAEESGPILVASQKAGTSVGFYTLEGEQLAKIPVSAHPHEIVRSSDGRYLYVTDNGVMQIENAGEGGNAVSIIDLESRQKVGQIDLGEWHRPHGIDLCEDGKLLVTTENPDQLLVIDPETRQITKELETGGETPHIVKCGPDSQTAYVSNARSDNVAIINLESGQRELIQTAARPEGSAFSEDHSKLYVVHRDADKIAVIDVEQQEVVGEIETGDQPVRIGVAGDGKTLIYALYGENKVGFADLDTMEQVATIDVAGQPASLEMADGETALTCAQNADTCYVIDVPSRSIEHTVQVEQGAGPDPALLLEQS